MPMTLPWAPNPNKCAECKGVGLVVREVYSDLYECGFTTKAFTCPTCLGTGRAMPEVIDHKMLAAGGETVKTFLEIVGGCALVCGLSFLPLAAGFWWGFLVAAADARDRLTGKKPVDVFWRSRGMKDFGGRR